MKSKSLKTSFYYWLAMFLFLTVAVPGILSIGEVEYWEHTAFRVFQGCSVLAIFGWLCFRAGQESRS